MPLERSQKICGLKKTFVKHEEIFVKRNGFHSRVSRVGDHDNFDNK